MSEHWLVAGATRGIGLELAHQLAARGNHVTASARNEAARDELRIKLEKGADVDTLVFDTRDETGVRAAAEQIDEPIDVLVVNAGAYGPERQSPLDLDYEGALELFSINSLGPMRVAHAFLPHLRKSGNARIVFVSSVMGSMAYEGVSNIAYRAAKAALNKFAQGLAAALEGQNVAVLVVHPGWVRTDMGGPDAPLSPKESAAGLIEVIDAATIEETGLFLDYRGKIVAW
jgi:NAD(P)-dependent dehydrogenase (short-subunit alcohol dehydrogenase family)